jgi:hypothetical protein
MYFFKYGAEGDMHAFISNISGLLSFGVFMVVTVDIAAFWVDTVKTCRWNRLLPSSRPKIMPRN